jgi:hypothetical protein
LLFLLVSWPDGVDLHGTRKDRKVKEISVVQCGQQRTARCYLLYDQNTLFLSEERRNR